MSTLPVVQGDISITEADVTVSAADPEDCEELDSEEEIVGYDNESEVSDDLKEAESRLANPDEAAAIDEEESWQEAIDFALSFHDQFKYSLIYSVDKVPRRISSSFVLSFSDDEWEVCKILASVSKDGVDSDNFYYLPVHSTTRLEYNFPSCDYGRGAPSNTKWLLLE